MASKIHPISRDELAQFADSADRVSWDLTEAVSRIGKSVMLVDPDYREAARIFARLAQLSSRLVVLCLAGEERAAQQKDLESLRAAAREINAREHQ